MSGSQAAMDYVRRGLSVIPIKPKDKKSLIAWEIYQKEPASEATVKHWFESWPSANVGIVTGAVSGCVVIDIDSDQARLKLKSLLGDYELGDVPRTRTGKGWQLFFAHPGEIISNRAGVLPGLDVRGDGGYVVAPPSIHPNGKAYKWEVAMNGQLPALPSELLKLIQTANHHEDNFRQRFNTAQALAGVPEGQRDETVFRFACKLRNADVPREMAETLILEAARNCQPPFSESVALEKVNRAYARYEPGQSKNGAVGQVALWPELLSAKDLLELPPDPTRWVWDQTLPAGGASILVSKPKIGKTHLAVNLSIAVARGIPFLGRATQQCGIVYLSLDATLPEIAETFLSFGLKATDPVYLHAGAAPAEALKWVMQRVNEKGARLVIVDTLQRLFRFQNVNDYSEVTNALEPLLEAARQQNCHVMFTHHAKKDAGDDLDSAIGSTAIRGLAYAYLHLKRLANSERRILRSDQRSGKNIPECGIGFDRATGWLTIQGTMESVEIEDAKPKIRELLEGEDGELTERQIRTAVPLRGIIVSKALREMFKAGEVERTGDGKKGRPFLYCLSSQLVDGRESPMGHSDGHLSPKVGWGGEGFLRGKNDSCPILSLKESTPPGHESKKDGQVTENTKKDSCPVFWDTNGTRTDTNPKTDPSGHEFGEAKLEGEKWTQEN